MGWRRIGIYGEITLASCQIPHLFVAHSIIHQTLSSNVGEQGGLYYTSPPGSSKYGEDAFGREFKMSEVSKEARASDDGIAKRFWDFSEKLVGV